MEKTIFNKFIILMLCLSTLLSNDSYISFLIALLCTIIISSLISYFADSKTTILLIALFILCSFFNKLFVFFLPVILYDIFQLFNKKQVILLCIIPVYSCLIYPEDMLYKNILTIILYSLISLSLAYNSYQYDHLLTSYKMLRDSTTEMNMNLNKKNKMLMEKQDYEIRLATLHERTRIAREIHDNVGHMLSRSLLQVGALMAIAKEELVLENLTALKNTLNDAMNSIRSSVHDLKEDALDLNTNILTLLEDFKSYTINYEYDADNSLPKNIKYSILTIIKESLANIAKHSNADTISIIIRQHPSFCQLLISDNGTDIMINSSGIGLDNMRERVEAFNGNFKISTNDGFKIFISIPLIENSYNLEK